MSMANSLEKFLGMIFGVEGLLDLINKDIG